MTKTPVKQNKSHKKRKVDIVNIKNHNQNKKKAGTLGKNPLNLQKSISLVQMQLPIITQDNDEDEQLSTNFNMINSKFLISNQRSIHNWSLFLQRNLPYTILLSGKSM